MDAALVTEVLLPSQRTPTFALPILRAAPQSNARYVQVLDLNGRVSALETCQPPLDLCVTAPAPYAAAEVGGVPIHAVVGPDGVVHVGDQPSLAPIVSGWLDDISHAVTRLAFAEFAGAHSQGEASAAKALDDLTKTAGAGAARRWYVDAVIRPHVHRALLRRGAAVADVAQLERLAGYTEIHIQGRDLRIVLPAELNRDMKVKLAPLGDQFDDALRYARALDVRDVLVEIRPAEPNTWRRQSRPAVPTRPMIRCAVVIVGQWDLFVALTGHRSPAEAIDEHGESFAVHVRVDDTSILFVRTLDMVGRVFDDLLERRAGRHARAILVVHDAFEASAEAVGAAFAQLRDRVAQLGGKANIETAVAHLPGRIDDFARRSEAQSLEIGLTDAVLSLGNAWTPRPGRRGRSGGPARVAECIEAWIAVTRSGALQQWRAGNKAARSTLLLSAARAVVAVPAGANWAVSALANPLWPSAGAADLLVVAGGSPSVGLERQPVDIEDRAAAWQERFRRHFTADQPDRGDGEHLPGVSALSVTELPVQSGRPREYVADVLHGLGWLARPDPSEARPDSLTVERSGRAFRMDVVSSFAEAEGGLDQARGSLGRIVVVTESGRGRHSDVLGFESLPQLAKVVAGERDRGPNEGFASQMARLPENHGLAMSGASIDPASILDASLARTWLEEDPSLASRILAPMVSGRDVARFPEGRWVVNFAGLEPDEAQATGRPFEYVMNRLAQTRPTRTPDRLPAVRERVLALGLEPSSLVSASVSKHRIFIRCRGVLAFTNSVVIVRETMPWMLALLSSSVHRIWSEAMGGRRGGASRYTVRAAETFPMPAALIEGDKGSGVGRELAQLSDQLAHERMAWQFTGLADVDDALSDAFLTSLTRHFIDEEWRAFAAERALTQLYNRPPPWLVAINERINSLVLEAYGLPPDASQEQVLSVLADLNRTRANAVVRWPRA